MASKITIILGAIIAVSIIANVYLYQKSTSLENTILHLQLTNNELSNSLANAKNNNNQTLTTIKTGSPPTTMGGSATTPSPLANEQQSRGENNKNNFSLNYTSQSITAVAVKAVPMTDGFFESVQYLGTVMDITVDIRDGGKGLVLVNTEVPTGVDFQTSARTAVKVAQSMTGVTDLNKKDVIFSIKSNGNNNTTTSNDLQAVDGPSAGAAMTVLLAAELSAAASDNNNNNSTTLKQNVVMTGTINPDGTIGAVGGVPEKAIAAGQYGAKIFLVPADQAIYNEQTCEKKQEGPFVYQTCRSQEKPLSDYTERNYGMKVIEVKNIKEALAYFQS